MKLARGHPRAECRHQDRQLGDGSLLPAAAYGPLVGSPATDPMTFRSTPVHQVFANQEEAGDLEPGIHRLTGTRRGPGSIWAGCRETIPQQVLLPFLKPIQILFVQGHLAVTDNSCHGLTLSVNYISRSGSYNEGSNSANAPAQ